MGPVERELPETRHVRATFKDGARGEGGRVGKRHQARELRLKPLEQAEAVRPQPRVPDEALEKDQQGALALRPGVKRKDTGRGVGRHTNESRQKRVQG